MLKPHCNNNNEKKIMQYLDANPHPYATVGTTTPRTPMQILNKIVVNRE